MRDALRAAGIEEFVPTHAIESRWTDRTVITTRALFPGYVFARCGADTGALLAIRGAVQILGTDRPEAIPDEVITNLQRIEAANPAAASLCAYVAGDSVTVASGPFAGVTGVISRVKGATTLYIPVAILGRAVSVAIDATDME